MLQADQRLTYPSASETNEIPYQQISTAGNGRQKSSHPKPRTRDAPLPIPEDGLTVRQHLQQQQAVQKQLAKKQQQQQQATGRLSSNDNAIIQNFPLPSATTFKQPTTRRATTSRSKKTTNVNSTSVVTPIPYTKQETLPSSIVASTSSNVSGLPNHHSHSAFQSPLPPTNNRRPVKRPSAPTPSHPHQVVVGTSSSSGMAPSTSLKDVRHMRDVYVMDPTEKPILANFSASPMTHITRVQIDQGEIVGHQEIDTPTTMTRTRVAVQKDDFGQFHLQLPPPQTNSRARTQHNRGRSAQQLLEAKQELQQHQQQLAQQQKELLLQQHQQAKMQLEQERRQQQELRNQQEKQKEAQFNAEMTKYREEQHNRLLHEQEQLPCHSRSNDHQSTAHQHDIYQNNYHHQNNVDQFVQEATRFQEQEQYNNHQHHLQQQQNYEQQYNQQTSRELFQQHSNNTVQDEPFPSTSAESELPRNDTSSQNGPMDVGMDVPFDDDSIPADILNSSIFEDNFLQQFLDDPNGDSFLFNDEDRQLDGLGDIGDSELNAALNDGRLSPISDLFQQIVGNGGEPALSALSNDFLDEFVGSFRDDPVVSPEKPVPVVRPPSQPTPVAPPVQPPPVVVPQPEPVPSHSQMQQRQPESVPMGVQRMVQRPPSPLDEQTLQTLAILDKKEEEDMYKKKAFFMEKSLHSLVFKNAALMDEVGRLAQRIQTVTDERKILARRLNHFEKNHLRRLNTAKKKREELARQKESQAAAEAQQKMEQIKAAAAIAAANRASEQSAARVRVQDEGDVKISPKKREKQQKTAPKSVPIRNRRITQGNEEQIKQEVNELLMGIRADQRHHTNQPIKHHMRDERTLSSHPLVNIVVGTPPVTSIPVTSSPSFSYPERNRVSTPSLLQLRQERLSIEIKKEDTPTPLPTPQVTRGRRKTSGSKDRPSPSQPSPALSTASSIDTKEPPAKRRRVTRVSNSSEVSTPPIVTRRRTPSMEQRKSRGNTPAQMQQKKEAKGTTPVTPDVEVHSEEVAGGPTEETPIRATGRVSGRRSSTRPSRLRNQLSTPTPPPDEVGEVDNEVKEIKDSTIEVSPKDENRRSSLREKRPVEKPSTRTPNTRASYERAAKRKS